MKDGNIFNITIWMILILTYSFAASTIHGCSSQYPVPEIQSNIKNYQK